MNLAKRHNTRSSCFYHFLPSESTPSSTTSTSASKSSQKQTSLDVLQDQLTKKGGGSVGLYISPTCALVDKLSRSSHLSHLEWLIFHSVTLGTQATMNVCSLVDPHWVTASNTRKLSSIDVDRLVGRVKTSNDTAATETTTEAVSLEKDKSAKTLSTDIKMITNTEESESSDSLLVQKRREEMVNAARERYLKRKKIA
jgi:hypothetical protein